MECRLCVHPGIKVLPHGPGQDDRQVETQVVFQGIGVLKARAQMDQDSQEGADAARAGNARLLSEERAVSLNVVQSLPRDTC